MCQQETFDRIQARAVVAPSPCHTWPGADSGNGYGRICVDGKTKAVHILVWEYHNGPVPPGFVVDHVCSNRRCCFIEHLRLKTALENTLIGTGPTAINAKKTHCKWGHPFNTENTAIRMRNGRATRECIACRNPKNKVARQ